MRCWMSKQARIVGVLCVAAALSMTPAAVAAGQGRGRGADKHDKHDKHDKKTEKSHDTANVVVFDRDGHVRVIREYAHAGSLPPGLAKREALPPGLREQLREHAALPPGLQKRLVPVP